MRILSLDEIEAKFVKRLKKGSGKYKVNFPSNASTVVG
jgi:hypothetical protein